MRVLSKWIMTISLCAVCLGLLAGCGKPFHPADGGGAQGDPASSPQAQNSGGPAAAEMLPEESLAQKLQIRTLPESKDEGFPDRSAKPEAARASEDIVATGTDIVFRKTIDVTKPVFLVWHEAAFGPKIVDAHFIQRQMNPDNQERGAPDRTPVSFDRETRRWFIPLAKIVSDPMDADPAENRLLDLDLVLASGVRIELHLSFRVLGALPRIIVTSSRPAITGTSEEIERQVSDGGITLLQEIVSNPSKRSLRIWVRPSRSAVAMTTGLKVPRYSVTVYTMGPVAEMEYASSVAPVADVHLRLTRGGKAPLEIPVSPEQWRSFELEPLETVRLEWLAHSESAVCGFPAPTVRTLQWVALKYSPCDIQDNCTYLAQGNFTEAWSLAGVTLSGKWSRQLRLSDPYLPVDKSTATLIPSDLKERLVEFAPFESRYADTFGDVPSSSAPAQCQGKGWH